MKRSISQQSMNPPESGRPFLRTLSIEPDSPATPGYNFDEGHHNVVAYTKLPRELFRIAAYNTGQVFVAGQTKLAKEKIKRDKDGYVQDAEGKRVPVVLQYSSFDFLKDKAKAIVEAHAKEAVQRWNV
jgi:hypothetical protein